MLGKLDITWRSTLGEPGRLQTQQIMGNAQSKKEVELRVLEVPPRIEVEKPFLVRGGFFWNRDKVRCFSEGAGVLVRCTLDGDCWGDFREGG
jgi:hypothetical protein